MATQERKREKEGEWQSERERNVAAPLPPPSLLPPLDLGW